MIVILKDIPHDLAEPIADCIRAAGVEARVIRPYTNEWGFGPQQLAQIMVFEESGVAAALNAAAGFMLSRLGEAATTPPEFDLSLIDPGVTVPCPSCSAAIPVRDRVQRPRPCDACGAAIDLESLAVEHLDPEVLAECYAEIAEAGSKAEGPDREILSRLDQIEARCPCGYSLMGHPRVSTCPECGRPYDKARLLLAPHLAPGVR